MGAGNKQRDTSKKQPKYTGNVVLKLWCFSQFFLVLTVPVATCPFPAYLGSQSCCSRGESIEGASLELQAGPCPYRMVAKQWGWCRARFAPAIWRNPRVRVVIMPQPWALEGELWRGKPSPRSCWQHAHKFVLRRRRPAHSSKLHSFSAQELFISGVHGSARGGVRFIAGSGFESSVLAPTDDLVFCVIQVSVLSPLLALYWHLSRALCLQSCLLLSLGYYLCF